MQSPVDTSKLPNENTLKSMVSNVSNLTAPSSKASTNEMERKTANSTFSFKMPSVESIGKEHASLPEDVLQSAYSKVSFLYGKDSVGKKANVDKQYDALTHNQFSIAIKNGDETNNRYNNVLPSDANVYQIPEKQFYYNCSCVLGDATKLGEEYRQTSRIIAAQGPMRPAVKAFWEMVISSNSGAIFKLVNTIEQDIEKCAPYYPTCVGESLQCGYYNVKLSAEKVLFPKYDVKETDCQIIERELTVSWMTKEGPKQKTIMQYHLKNWPDRGVVQKEILAELVKIGAIKINEGRIVVHCSAGVGRSGVFITTLVSHLAIEEGKGSDKIVFETASALRQVNTGRVGSLSDKNQYKLCYLTLNYLHP